MKKIPFFIGLTFLMMSCSDSPSTVAENFAVSLNKGKVEEAKKYCTESTAMLINMAASLGGVKANPDFKINIIRDSIVDNKAWVFYKEENRYTVKSMELVKIDGEWKVDIDNRK